MSGFCIVRREGKINASELKERLVEWRDDRKKDRKSKKTKQTLQSL